MMRLADIRYIILVLAAIKTQYKVSLAQSLPSTILYLT